MSRKSTARRSTTVSVGMVGAVAVALAATATGCATGESVQAACVNKHTQQRLDDDYCDNDHHHHYSPGLASWYYFGAGKSIPPVGGRVSRGSGSYKAPRSASIVRGGFRVGGGKAPAAHGFGRGISVGG